ERMRRSGSPQIDPATVDEAFILDRWLNKHWGHPAILNLGTESLPDADSLRAWLDGAFETDFERWTPPPAEEGEDVVLDIQQQEHRVADTHDGWMPPHMIEGDIQGIFG
ncbi:MAG TPA: hypothetical protein VFP05_18555, partial [Thermomicrobiales bacterium]|nr:hypothetical protein [Thermomicrobiales bacterium]